MPMDYNYQDPRNTVYSAGNGFYSQYVEPLWKKEKKAIRRAGNGLGFTSLGYVAVSLILGIFMGVFVLLFDEYAKIPGLLPLSEAGEWIFTLLTYILTLSVPFGIYTLCIKMPLKVALPFRKAKIGLTAGGVCIGLGISVIASYATAYLQMGLELFGIGLTMPEYETPTTLIGIILYFITLSVAPAFIEEIVFRGVIMQSLRRFGDVFALIASALIFGIFHLNLIQMPYAFILGLGIGYFVMRTGSLWVGVIIHFINNFTATVFELLYPYISEEVYTLANLVYNLFWIVLAVISVVLILTKYKNIFRFEKRPSALSGGKKVLYFITSPGIVIAMIVAVLLTLPYIEFIG